MRGQDSEERLITSPPSTLQSGTSPLELQSVGFPKYPDTMPAQCDLSERPDDRLSLLTSYRKDLYLKGIFTPLEQWQECNDWDGDYVEQ